MNPAAQRKNIFLKCIRCKHAMRYHISDKYGNTKCEKCNCSKFE